MTRKSANSSGVRRRETKMEKIRRFFADYRYSEGCSCCRDQDAHDVALDELAKLLHIPQFSDGSGWDTTSFRTNIREVEDD